MRLENDAGFKELLKLLEQLVKAMEKLSNESKVEK